MREPCNTSNSVLESDLEIAAQKGIVQDLKVVEIDEGFFVIVIFGDKLNVMSKLKREGLQPWFYVLAQLLAEPGKEWYLTTRRDRMKPRIFKDLNKLNHHLKEVLRVDRFEVIHAKVNEAEARW